MNEIVTERLEQANLYLERMAAGRYPLSDTAVEHISDLNSAEVVRCLFFVRDVVKEMTENQKRKRQTIAKHQFSLACLDKFIYQEDKSITTFVSQLKSLAGDANVKGIGIKRITDWLKKHGYLENGVDQETGEKYTMITKAGEEAGLYTAVRHTRFGQEYEVIMYSEKAQLWLVENMSHILNG